MDPIPLRAEAEQTIEELLPREMLDEIVGHAGNEWHDVRALLRALSTVDKKMLSRMDALFPALFVRDIYSRLDWTWFNALPPKIQKEIDGLTPVPTSPVNKAILNRMQAGLWAIENNMDFRELAMRTPPVELLLLFRERLPQRPRNPHEASALRLHLAQLYRDTVWVLDRIIADRLWFTVIGNIEDGTDSEMTAWLDGVQVFRVTLAPKATTYDVTDERYRHSDVLHRNLRSLMTVLNDPPGRAAFLDSRPIANLLYGLGPALQFRWTSQAWYGQVTFCISLGMNAAMKTETAERTSYSPSAVFRG
jgi:hypothetical protein